MENLIIEYHYHDGDVGAHPANDKPSCSLWSGFSRIPQHNPSHILLRPASPEGQALSDRLHAIHEILRKYDGIEIQGCIEVDRLVEPATHGETPDFYTVYWHCRTGGVEALGDCATAADARAFSAVLAHITGFEIMDFADIGRD